MTCSNTMRGTPSFRQLRWWLSIICVLTMMSISRTVSASRSVSLTSTPIDGAPTDCSDYQYLIQVHDTMTMYYVIQTPTNNSSAAVLKAKLEYAGESWIAFGLAQDNGGRMIGSESIIGLPLMAVSYNNPGKYHMDAESLSGVYLRDDAEQTLMDGTIEQGNGMTTLTFTKYLSESGEIEILPDGTNNFLWAAGYDNYLGLHTYGAFTLETISCTPPTTTPTSDTTNAPAASPTLAPATTGNDDGDETDNDDQNDNEDSDGTGGTGSGSQGSSGTNSGTGSGNQGSGSNGSSGTNTSGTGSDNQGSGSSGSGNQGTSDGSDAGLDGSEGEGDTTTDGDEGEGNQTAVNVQATISPNAAVDCTSFQNTVSLRNDLTLAYVVNVPNGADVSQGTLTVKMEYDGEAWIAFGISANTRGVMVGSESIIALPGQPVSSTNPGKYSMTSQSDAGVFLMDNSHHTLTNGTVTQQNGITTLTFTKKLVETGELEISGNGTNTFIWAIGYTNDLSLHRSTGAFHLTLAPCGSSSASTGGSNNALESLGGLSEEKERNLWKAHGIMGAIAWAVCAPIAISASHLRALLMSFGLGPIWFKIHQYLNMCVFFLTLAVFGTAVYVYNQQGDQHFVGTHQTLGLVITLLVSLQALNGMMRPAAPKKMGDDVVEASSPMSSTKRQKDADVNEATMELSHENDISEVRHPDDFEVKSSMTRPAPSPPPKTKTRFYWELLHKIIGYSLLIMGVLQVQDGLELYEENFGTRNYKPVYWAYIGSFAAGVFLLSCYSRMRARRGAA